MNLHNEIMNIRVDTKIKENDYTDVDGCVDSGWISYKEGHRDARHAAAELSLKAEARIEELETVLKELYIASGPVANFAYNLGQSHEGWENTKQWIDKLDNARATAIKVFQENKQ